jgi:phospholipase C
MLYVYRTGLLAAFTFTLAGCSGQSAPASSAPALGALPATSRYAASRATHARKKQASPIQHIILVIQENRSLDNLFMGFPQANTVSSGYDHNGKSVPLKPVPLEGADNTHHDLGAFFDACDGTGSLPGTNCKMDGFDLEMGKKRYSAYAYVPQAEVQPYWTIAQQYVLADNLFPAQLDSSFVAHQYLIAAQAQGSVNTPVGSWGCDSNKPTSVSVLGQQRTIIGTQTPCFDYQTLGDELDSALLTWHFYAPGSSKSHVDSKGSKTGTFWSAYRAVSHIRNGGDWDTDVIVPETQFLSDVQAGILENVTWVVPSFTDSDHPGSHSATGPSWVASIVNTVGQSQFWNSTAIIVVWDDWGGMYDHVPPPFEDYDGDGIRVPMLCVSPYASTGVVDHTQYDFGSIDRFIENTFGLAQLAASDARATSIDTGCLNYSQAPRRFRPIPARLGPSHFLHERPDARPPDDDF